MADLSNIKVGDQLAVRSKNGWDEFAPTHQILLVERVTLTQVACRHARGASTEVRFRRSDGKQIGEDYVYAEVPSQELLERLAETLRKRLRYTASIAVLHSLFGKERHQLKLSLEQMEALAAAWQNVQAMAQPQPAQ